MHKIDSTGATAGNEFTDGVPGITPSTVVWAKWLNTMQRELVAVVANAGLTLNTANDAQILEALGVIIQNNSYSIKAGMILPYSGIVAPTGFLATDGSAVSRTTYSTLFSAVTSSKGTFTVTIATPGVITLTGHGLATGDCVSITTTGTLPTGLSASTNYYVIYIDTNTFWLATSYANAIAGTKINTSVSQSGTHMMLYNPYGISGASNFLLPDTRAAFLRGSGTSTLFTANKTIGLGNYVNDQHQGHTHAITAPRVYGSTFASNVGWSSDTSLSGGTADITSGTSTSDGVNGTPRTGNETTPKFLGINYGIKF